MSYAQHIAAVRRMKIQRLAHRMLKLIRAYAAEDPCAPNDPRYIEALAILAEVDSL